MPITLIMGPQSVTPLPHCSMPSAQSIALALVIVQATPPGTLARDYVIQLRTHLKCGQPQFIEQHPGQYLDLLAYWQLQYKNVQEKCRELEEKVTNLERNLHRSALQPGVDPSTERKGASLTAKRPRRGKAPPPKPKSVEETLEGDFNLFEAFGKDGAIMVQHIWTSQKLFKQSETNLDAICSSIVGITGGLCRLLPIIAKSHDHLATRTMEQPDQKRSELSCSMTACVRAWNIVLVGLKILDKDDQNSRLARLVVFECVRMISVALDATRDAAHQAAKKKINSKASGTVPESVAAHNIAYLIATFIGHLEKDNMIHHQLFEGIVYILFERVGSRLYYCTFGRHRGATLEERIALPSTPSEPREIAQHNIESTAIRLEVKALIVVLERVMGVAPLHMNPQSTKQNKASTARTLTLKNLSFTRTKLCSLAKDRLQRTLVTCTFGNNVEDDFVDVLTRPVDFGPAPRAPKVEDKDVLEWYQSQVWRLIGWDILEKDEDWMKCGGPW